MALILGTDQDHYDARRAGSEDVVRHMFKDAQARGDVSELKSTTAGIAGATVTITETTEDVAVSTQWTEGGYINASGNNQTVSGYSYSGRIPCSEGDYFIGSIRFVCAYDSAETVIREKGSDSQISEYTVPAGIAYIVISTQTSNKGTIKKRVTETTYQNILGDRIDGIESDIAGIETNISGLESSIDENESAIGKVKNDLNDLLVTSENLFNGEWVAGEQVATSSGAFVPGNFSRTGHIPINAGKVYIGVNSSTQQNIGSHYCLYDGNKNKSQAGNFNSLTPVIAGEGAGVIKYVELTAAVDGYVAFDSYPGGTAVGAYVSQTAPTQYVPYVDTHIKTEYIAVDDTLSEAGLPADAKAAGDEIARIDNNSAIATMRGGSLTRAYAATMTAGDGLYSIRSSVQKNKKLIFKCAVHGEDWSVIIAHGVVDNTFDSSNYSFGYRITHAKVVPWTGGNNGEGGTEGMPWMHGLTIGARLCVEIDVHEDKTHAVRIMSESGFAEKEYESGFGGHKGSFYAKTVAGTLSDCELSYTLGDIAKPVWLFGDSYVNFVSNRYPYWMLQNKMCGALVNAYPGEASPNALLDLKSLLNIGKPRFIVWALGMNDHDSANAVNASWLSAVNEIAEICEAEKITLVLATIPNVPHTSYNNVQKNAWIHAHDYRFIDFNAAIGAADEVGAAWPEGWISADNVHPSEMGARVLAMQAMADMPEFGQTL